MIDFKSMKLGTFFAELRRRNRMSQEELEHKAGLSRKTISSLENNQSTPSFETLLKIALVFHIRPSALILELEEKTNFLQCMEYIDPDSD